MPTVNLQRYPTDVRAEPTTNPQRYPMFAQDGGIPAGSCFFGRHISMTTTLILLSIALITHALKPAFKRRAERIDGSASGVMAALAFTLLSIVSLGAALSAVISVIF